MARRKMEFGGRLVWFPSLFSHALFFFLFRSGTGCGFLLVVALFFFSFFFQFIYVAWPGGSLVVLPARFRSRLTTAAHDDDGFFFFCWEGSRQTGV